MSNKKKTVSGKPGLDPTLPNVKLVAGGKEYQLAYDFNAIVRATEVTGVNLLSSVVGEINAVSLRGLLWAALLKDQSDITIEEAGDLITPTNMGTIRQAIVTAWFGSIKDAEAGEVVETPGK